MLFPLLAELSQSRFNQMSGWCALESSRSQDDDSKHVIEQTAPYWLILTAALRRNWARMPRDVVVLGDTMKQNVHNIERVVRVIVGLVIISLVFIGPQSAWGWVGLIPLATGIIGWCPPYALFGFSTCKTPE